MRITFKPLNKNGQHTQHGIYGRHYFTRDRTKTMGGTRIPSLGRTSFRRRTRKSLEFNDSSQYFAFPFLLLFYLERTHNYYPPLLLCFSFSAAVPTDRSWSCRPWLKCPFFVAFLFHLQAPLCHCLAIRGDEIKRTLLPASSPF